MKKKIFLGAGTLALAVVAVFARRASSKFIGIVTLYYKKGLSTTRALVVQIRQYILNLNSEQTKFKDFVATEMSAAS